MPRTIRKAGPNEWLMGFEDSSGYFTPRPYHPGFTTLAGAERALKKHNKKYPL
jgi:hypothetical protein